MHVTALSIDYCLIEPVCFRTLLLYPDKETGHFQKLKL